MGNFKQDLIQGHIYELKSLNYLEYDTYIHDKAYRKEYDLIIIKDDKQIKIEVKSDKQASKTGNLAIEYECNNKPSGITSTEADFWMYFVVFEDRDECYKIPIEDLRREVSDCKRVAGGDGMRARMYLLRIKNIQKYLVEKII